MSSTEPGTTTTRPGRRRPRRTLYWVAAAAAIIMGTGLVTIVTTTNTTPTANADALCDQMRREHGPYWPCINVPTYTPQPTQNTPPPTAPNPGGPGSGPNAGGSPGPGPGTGNGTPIIPVPGYRAPGLPGQTPPAQPRTQQQQQRPPQQQTHAPAPQVPEFGRHQAKVICGRLITCRQFTITLNPRDTQRLYSYAQDGSTIAMGAACGLLAARGGTQVATLSGALCSILIRSVYALIGPPPEGASMRIVYTYSIAGISLDTEKTGYFYE